MRFKYNNKSCKCLLHHIHDSIWEAEVCQYLYSLLKSKRILAYKTQHSIDITVKGKTVCTHIVDFYVQKLNKKWFFAEAKGLATPMWQLKRKLTKALYPKIPYVVIYRGLLRLIDEEV